MVLKKKNERILSDLYILVSEIGENLFYYFTVEGFSLPLGLVYIYNCKINQIV